MTRMTTFIKTKLKKKDVLTTMCKYSIAAKYYRESYYVKMNLPKSNRFKIHEDKAIISYKKCM